MTGLRYWGGAIALLVSLPMAFAQRELPNAIPLKNWATPLYWQPNVGERVASGRSAAQIQFSPNAISNTALTFVAITPCRLVDTRGAAAGFIGASPFDGPSIPAGGTISIPVLSATESSTSGPAPCGAIPSIAQAYSLNLTVVPKVAGTAVDYVTMWPEGGTQPVVSTVDDPQGLIVSNAAIVPAGSPSGGFSVFNEGPAATDVVIDMNGYFGAPTDMSYNTAVGAGTLSADTSGGYNTATGADALQSNTTGSDNTATGASALQANYSGYDNTAEGASALQINSSGYQNTASGTLALGGNTTGFQNTAGGANALQNNSTGYDNTADGYFALHANTTGTYNTASGALALQNNTTGFANTVSGVGAMGSNTIGFGNTAVGENSMQSNTTGIYNTTSGLSTLTSNTTGSYNIAMGYCAGSNVSTGSNNIHIGSVGATADNGTIRIGTTPGLINNCTTPVSQTSFFAAGIRGVTTGSNNAVPVVIDSNGQLGTVSSSRRFKEDIHDMGEASSGLLRLRPVTFRYKQPFDDGLKPVQYGLIAEEVAEVYPDLVAHSADGQIETVKYQVLDSMLLNEVQKQAAVIRGLEERLAALETRLASGALAK